MWKFHYEDDEMLVEGSHDREHMKVERKSDPDEPFLQDPISDALMFHLSSITIIGHICQKLATDSATEEEKEMLKKLVKFSCKDRKRKRR